MEEILASIRRIIADEDKDAPGADAKADDDGETHVTEDDLDKLFASGPEMPEDTAAEEEGEDVLDLTEEAVEANEIDLVEAEDDDLAFAEAPAPPPPAPKPKPVAKAPEPAPAPRPRLPDPAPVARAAEPLISDEAGMAVAAAFGSLSGMSTHKGGRTMEELVQDMMRPMLKSWLDANLPPLVERLVRAEIERVSRNGM
jgi:cell pole-organizing protein PopZ